MWFVIRCVRDRETPPSRGDSDAEYTLKEDWKGNNLVACVQMSRSFVAAWMVFRSLVELHLTASLVPASSTVLDRQHLPIQLSHKHHPDTNTNSSSWTRSAVLHVPAGASYHLELSKRIALCTWTPMAIILCELHSVIDVIQLMCTSRYFVHSVCTWVSVVRHSFLIYLWQ